MLFVGTENLSGAASGDNGKSGTPSKSASPKDGSPAPSGLAKVIQMALNVNCGVIKYTCTGTRSLEG